MLGLASRYNKKLHFSKFVKKLCALAFLPIERIPEAFENLKSKKVKDTTQLLNFFEKNYILSIKSPPEFWSVYERCIMSLPRTTNSVEAWHRRMQSILGKTHLGLSRMVLELKKEYNSTFQKILDVEKGKQISRKSKYVKMDQEILNVINDIGNRTLDEFLSGISYKISL